MHVLLVDDSSISRLLLRTILEGEGFRVTEAANGQVALAQLEVLQPDLITMDVHMPGMDGFETTRRIMQQRPTPIVIVSGGVNMPGAQAAMKALEAGALMVLDKPTSPSHPQFQLHADILGSTLQRLAHTTVRHPDLHADAETTAAIALKTWLQRPIKLLAIGASAGGPPALKNLLSRLGADCPWPVLLVQHISPGFAQSYCEWLADQTPLPVQLASADTIALPGHIYVAPDNLHLRIGSNLVMHLDSSANPPFIRPSIDVLFDSMASQLRGDVVAILLSGMGQDGVDGLAKLKALGALTLVQQPSSAVVEGIPQAAIARNAACFVQTPRGMADTLKQLVQHR